MELGDIWVKIANNQRLTAQELDFLRGAGRETQLRNTFIAGNTSPDGSLIFGLPIEIIYSEVLYKNFPTLSVDIPQGYKHLLIFSVAKTDRASDFDYIHGYFNGDSGSNYMEGYAGEASGSAVGWVGEQTSRSNFGVCFASASTSSAGAVGSSVLFVPHYTSSAWKATLKIMGGNTATSTALLTANSIWKNTSAINKITFFPEFGTNIVSGSIFSIYGIK